jgi:hypothetical protein
MAGIHYPADGLSRIQPIEIAAGIYVLKSDHALRVQLISNIQSHMGLPQRVNFAGCRSRRRCILSKRMPSLAPFIWSAV